MRRPKVGIWGLGLDLVFRLRSGLGGLGYGPL